MDNVDGKQARRTGQSSGLGELFECVPFQKTILSVTNKSKPRYRLPQLHSGKLV